MKKVILACLLVLSSSLATQDSLLAMTNEECLINWCLPGVNDCSNCCEDEWEAAGGGACWSGCWETYSSCIQTCQQNNSAASCFAQYLRDRDWQKLDTCTQEADLAYQQCVKPCQKALDTCDDSCEQIQITGSDCPGAQEPATCPYTCQSYNPASRSCVGAALNAC